MTIQTPFPAKSKATPLGEPDAGNLHVRFYEGGGGNSSPTPLAFC